ncbi:hypothetical protein OAZ27_02635 [Bacteroidia bacterium]|nr:hypothetical protein [Bacteroidia bacterium]
MDINKFQSALKDFAIAYYQKQGELTQVLPVNQTNGQIPNSFPDLVVSLRNTYINALDQSNEQISKEDKDLLDALNEVVETFPLWTVNKLGDSIKAKLEGFLYENDLDMSIELQRTLYGNTGDIAFASYLETHNHKHPLLNKYSHLIIISNIIQKIDDMLKLIRYDKSDLKNILSATIYMKDNPALVLSSDYVNTNKLFEDFNNIENIVNEIKSITGWNYIKSSNMLCDLLEGVKICISNISVSKHLITAIADILNEKNVKKTTQYVFINDVLYPFVDGLKSQEDIRISLEKNNELINNTNINRQKRRAVEKILSRKN